MKQKKEAREKKLVQAFHRTNDPIRLNNVFTWEAENFNSDLRGPGKPRAIAVCSEFALHDLLKYFSGVSMLREECRKNNVSLKYEDALFKPAPQQFCFSTIFKMDPSRPFTGLRKIKSKHPISMYELG